MPRDDAIADVIRALCAPAHPLAEDTDLFAALGVDGDDAFDFADRFNARFDVDLADYRW